MAELSSRKLGFIGAGNMTQAIVSGLIKTGTLRPDQIWASNRSDGKLKRLQSDLGISTATTNEEVVDQCDIVILAMKPQDLIPAIEPISSSFTPQHTVISLAAGIPIRRLRRAVPSVRQWIRAMPNTAARIQSGVVGYCTSAEGKASEGMIEALFSPLGLVVPMEEGEKFEAFSVACSAGVGFVFELMMYWQEWLEEHDFDPEVARAVTVRTFLGASRVAEDSTTGLEDLQNRVTSKKGITAAGLDSMRELEIERLLRYSFEKSALRDRQIAEEQDD